ncbi:hypothetical protein Tsubulata_051252 [Turnera subulata]|uniref:Uncharacterized protein n=1 Tax=Turnera subulata TaxID=218843 RepID=A0A9Q0G107_9ROSI|nr:hypothetical protein Tsubulata_051252 [Turnera subulata]
MGLNQRPGIVDMDAGSPCGKADTNPSYSLNLAPTSPLPTTQQTQNGTRGSWSSSMEQIDKNSSSLDTLTNPEMIAHSTKKDGPQAALHVSEGVKEMGLDTSSLSSTEMLLNLEFTLGRPTWQMEYADSSNELTPLKC